MYTSCQANNHIITFLDYAFIKANCMQSNIIMPPTWEMLPNVEQLNTFFLISQIY